MKNLLLILCLASLSVSSLANAETYDRLDLDRAIRYVEASDYAFDRSGEYAAQNELRDADYILRSYDRDYDIRNARLDIASAVRMLDDRYMSRRDKQIRLNQSIRQIVRNIQSSPLYRRPLPPPERSFLVRCESIKDFPRSCDLGRAPAYRVVLVDKHSSASCTEGRSWGVDFSRNNLWVSRGCRATFRVYIR